MLKDTKTFSTNFLIKLFYKLKELKLTEFDNLKLFTDSIKPLIKEETVKIENSGYLSFLNTEKDEEQVAQAKKEEKKKILPKVQQHEEEKKKDIKTEDEKFNYTQYFNEFVPMTEEQKKKEFKHNYTVQITKAIANQASFNVFLLYEENVHGKAEKSFGSYDRFLCSNPLFDPLDPQERTRNPLENKVDKNR